MADVTRTMEMYPPFIAGTGLEFSKWLTGDPGTEADPTGYTSQLDPIAYEDFMGLGDTATPDELTGGYVAPQDQFTLDAQTAAQDPTYGLGMYQPYLKQASDLGTQAMGIGQAGLDVADPYLTAASGAYGTGLAAAQAGQNVGAGH